MHFIDIDYTSYVMNWLIAVITLETDSVYIVTIMDKVSASTARTEVGHAASFISSVAVHSAELHRYEKLQVLQAQLRFLK